MLEAARATVRVMSPVILLLTAMHQAWSGKSGRDTKEGRTHGAYSLVVCRLKEAKREMGHITPTPGGQEKEWWVCGSKNSQWEAGKWGAGCVS